MTRLEMKKILARRAALVENFFEGRIAAQAPSRLRESMLYSLKAGGKRIRPCLCLSCAVMCGLDEDKALPFAAAIEMIHTYSLIHDDLPAMDDDDLRRGKPSNHKKFDEATAILAGDALLTDAFSVACASPLPGQAVLGSLARLAEAAGSGGMVGGQMLDMLYTGINEITLEQVEGMQALKTGAMLEAACACGALLADAPEELLLAVSSYGANLGRAFQISDDILDIIGAEAALGKPVGSDEKSGKNTFPVFVGIDKSRELARQAADKAKAALPDLPEASFLARLADYVVEREG